MKKLLCAVLAVCMLLLCACGEAAPATDEISTPAPAKAPVGAEALTEVCRVWYDIAANSGAAEDGQEYPLAERAHDGGSFTCEGSFWLQNSVLEVRGGTVHITGDCTLERGGINVSGGTLIIDGSLWLGEGDVTVTGGELVIPGGEEAVALDNGSVNVTGGAISNEIRSEIG